MPETPGSDLTPPRYEADPCYPPVTGTLEQGTLQRGWAAAAATLPPDTRVLAIDGPAILDWPAVVRGLGGVLHMGGWLDVRELLLPWDELVEKTSSGELRDDPDFDRLADGTLADLFLDLPVPANEGMTIVYGPGAALVEHDVLWYADLPKRYAEAAIAAGQAGNLGQPPGQPGTTKRLFYIDWPLLDRHRDAIAHGIDLWIDTQSDTQTGTQAGTQREPALIDGGTLRATIGELARRPFRTRPTFNTTSWGGHWAQRTLSVNQRARNTALGYELIAPESGVLIGDHGTSAEIPFQLIVALYPEAILGQQVHETFGTSFPVRFDYLDTAGGGNLSVHCHPRPDYMRETFGWPYTQHETYYLMVGGDDRRVFLGLRKGADIDAFHAAATRAHADEIPFDITDYVQTFPATRHQLFLIPAGTPHGSGEGNVVLEVSATPYLYSLRFYDWLRRDADGNQRPVHVEHAFRNLNVNRTGADVARDLIQPPRTIAKGDGWQEELIGALPEMFFEVRRFSIDAGATAEDSTAGRFHVLNVVAGDGVMITTQHGDRHALAYAETLVVPAAAGSYTIRGLGTTSARVVKAAVLEALAR